MIFFLFIIGLQHGVISASEPLGLPLKFRLLPEYLSKVGYINRIVGKWHLGHCKRTYTPLSRGFDSHFGYWTGRIDYYSHTCYGRVGFFKDKIYFLLLNG